MGNCWNAPTKVGSLFSSKGHSVTSSGKVGTAKLPSAQSEGEILSSSHAKALSFIELRNATRNFRPDSLLGEGGFGYVYKGYLDEQTLNASRPGSGIVVAVKKLKPKASKATKNGWWSEVNYLGQLHHPNLVKLLGYCLEGDNRLLVYEFMPKGSLENHLFKTYFFATEYLCPSNNIYEPLSDSLCLIAIAAARGLSFLHSSESPVIYRDFKASNILLDSEFNAKLSDFGLAKAGPTGDQTHVSTQVMGTQGYAAPEYIATGRLTTSCDVYSFGVVLLELLTGLRAVDKTKVGVEQKLVEWAKIHLDDKRRIFRIMDTKLAGQYPRKGACIAAALAMECVGSNPKARPDMNRVLSILEGLPSLKLMSLTSLSEQPTLSSPVTPEGSPLPYHMISPQAR
ncbi:Non-specific serine/threonine protein kinase [Bertholletia excelsa]